MDYFKGAFELFKSSFTDLLLESDTILLYVKSALG